MLGSLWRIDRTLSGTTTENNGNEEVLYIFQNFKAGALPSDCLLPYPRYSLVGTYSPAKIQLVYSTAPAD